MTFTDIWNYIVSQREKNYNAPETVVQQEWELYFSDFFNYKRVFGEIDAHRNIHIGASQRTIPDIIIKSNGKDLLDVELKQYNLPFSSEMENQLKSYMDLLHVSVGMLICQKIYIYIYNFSQSKFKKAEVQFTQNNPDGIKLVELLQKEAFSVDKIEAFIDSKNSFENNINEIIDELTAENALNILKSHFESIYSPNEVDSAFEKLSINITKISHSPAATPATTSYITSQPRDTSHGGMDYSRYCFQGEMYGKSQLVLAVVKAYVKDNPSITYSTLKSIFYDRLQGSTGVVATPDEVRAKRKDPEKRYHTKHTIYLKNEAVWVSTQWGIGNIDNFINRAISLGYKIEKAQF